jgi:hypothetical protein
MGTILCRSRPRRFRYEDSRPFETSRTCVGIVERNDSGWVHRIVDASRKEPIHVGSGRHPIQGCENPLCAVGPTT